MMHGSSTESPCHVPINHRTAKQAPEPSAPIPAVLQLRNGAPFVLHPVSRQYWHNATYRRPCCLCRKELIARRISSSLRIVPVGITYTCNVSDRPSPNLLKLIALKTYQTGLRHPCLGHVNACVFAPVIGNQAHALHSNTSDLARRKLQTFSWHDEHIPDKLRCIPQDVRDFGSGVNNPTQILLLLHVGQSHPAAKRARGTGPPD